MEQMFQVGEVVEVSNKVHGPTEWVGREVEVVAAIVPWAGVGVHADGTVIDVAGKLIYRCKADWLLQESVNGITRPTWGFMPYELRRRPQPPDWMKFATGNLREKVES